MFKTPKPFTLVIALVLLANLAPQVTATSFLRGDANQDERVDLTDAVDVLTYNCRSGRPQF